MVKEIQYQLRLYIAGQTPKSVTALKNITKYCEGDQIFAIPTLVRKVPEPIRKIIGDLSNEEKVLVGLNIRKLQQT